LFILIKAERIGQRRLERGVAPTMEHKRGIPAEEPRRVDAERDIRAHLLLRVTLDHALRIPIRPHALHAASDPRGRAKIHVNARPWSGFGRSK
jgi:hypothetical protein